jgi:hypothetical protein
VPIEPVVGAGSEVVTRSRTSQDRPILSARQRSADSRDLTRHGGADGPSLGMTVHGSSVRNVSISSIGEFAPGSVGHPTEARNVAGFDPDHRGPPQVNWTLHSVLLKPPDRYALMGSQLPLPSSRLDPGNTSLVCGEASHSPLHPAPKCGAGPARIMARRGRRGRSGRGG